MAIKNYPDRSYRFIFLLIAFEGLLAGVLTYLIPGEGTNSIIGGLSLQRLVLITIIFFISLFFSFLSFNNQISNFIITVSYTGIIKKPFLFIFFILLGGLFLFFPPLEVIQTYPAHYHRLLYISLWLWLSLVEICSIVIYSLFSKTGFLALFDSLKNKARTIFPWVLCFIFPFLYMTPRLWIFGEHHYAIGNDFVPFSYFYRVYILDYFVHFRLPFWSPSEGAGFPYLFSPQTGALYPLNLLFSLIYWWKGSYSLIDHTWATVLGISIYSCGLFAWLQEFHWNKKIALFSSLLISVSYQLTEIIRFTKGVESIAWVPWLLFFTTRMLKNPSIKQSFLFYFGLSFTVFSFITAGYMYYQYYSIFILFPFFFFLLLPRTRNTIGFSDLKIKFKDVIRPSLSILLPVVILLPYLINSYFLLQQVYRRGVRDYFYSVESTFNWVDHLGSIVYPPIASPEGWYYFGILPLFCVILYFFLSSDKRKKVKSLSFDRQWYISPLVKIFMGFMLVMILTISLGKDSIIFNTLWLHFPFFYAFRYWGRFTIMLLPIIGFVLTASFNYLFTFFSNSTNGVYKTTNRKFYLIPFFICVVIGILIIWSRFFPKNHQWDISFYLVNSRIWLYDLSAVISLIFIFIFSLLIIKKKLSVLWLKILPVIFFIITIVDLWPIGAFQWLIDSIPEKNPPGQLNIKEKIIPQSFSFPRTVGKTTISITPRFSVGPSPDWYFDRYVNFYHKHTYEYPARDKLLGREKDGSRLFLTRNISYENISDFLTDSENFRGAINVEYYDGEILEVEIDTEIDGYFSFIDNWDPFWKVNVNGETSHVEKLFGTFKSVEISRGKSKVIFHYEPELFPPLVFKQ